MTKIKTFRNKLHLLAVFSVLFFMLGNKARSQAPPVDISAKIESSKKQKGEALIHTEEGKYKLYASYSKKKLTHLYAIDITGKKIDATYTKEKNMADGERCFACIDFLGLTICHAIDCGQVPPPKTKSMQ